MIIEWTPRYISSQIVALIVYSLLVITFFYKKRKGILYISTASVFLQIPMFLLQDAWSAAAMSCIVLCRNIYMMIVYKETESEETTKEDKRAGLIILTAIIICAYFTYEGFGSMLAVVGTLIFTYSLYQKNVFAYKWLNIICCLVWLFYSIYIFSIVQIIFEVILTISAVAGTAKHIIDNNGRVEST